MQKKILLITTCLLALSACKDVPELNGFDKQLWKADKKGCQQKRAPLVSSLEAQQKKLLGLSQLQIIELLGRPDEQRLSKRNQKYYIYFFERGSQCGQSQGNKGNALAIRFGALDQADEISRQRY